jgi:hypothetical protein
MIIQCGCFNPHHVLDIFKNQSGSISDKCSGLVFYDWWRTQPGVLIVNTQNGNCAAVHMMGYKMGEWPGQFCLLLSEGRSFSAAGTPALKNSGGEKIWSLDMIENISDAYWDDERGWIWLLTEKPKPQEILAVNAEDGKVLFQWSYTGDGTLLGLYEQRSQNTSVMAYTNESLIAIDISSRKPVATSPLKSPVAIQQLGNGNILFRDSGFSETSANGRLVWQWKEPSQTSWGRKVVGRDTHDFVNVFRSKSVENQVSE